MKTKFLDMAKAISLYIVELENKGIDLSTINVFVSFETNDAYYSHVGETELQSYQLTEDILEDLPQRLRNKLTEKHAVNFPVLVGRLNEFDLRSELPPGAVPDSVLSISKIRDTLEKILENKGRIMKRLIANPDHSEEKFWNGKGGDLWRILSGGYMDDVVVEDRVADSIINYLTKCDGFAYYARDGYGAPYLEEAVIVDDVEECDNGLDY